METLTRTQLSGLFAVVPQPQEVKLLTKTVLAEKTPFGTIYKENRIEGVIGESYQKAVRTEQKAAGHKADFVAGKLPWGTKVGAALVEHKGEQYGQVFVKESFFPRYVTENNRELTPEEVEPYLPKRKPSAKQSEAGVKKQVIIATYKLRSIQSLVIGGRQFVIH